MKRFNSIKELKPYYHKETNTYIFDDDVTFNFNLIVDSNIEAYDITAYNIIAHNIDALNINADVINAGDIKALNIDAEDIKAGVINARDIDALNIDAYFIDARNISYFAFCIAYQTFTCESVKGRRHNSSHKCLDGDIVIRKPKQNVTLEVTEEQLNKIKKLLEETK